MSEVLLLGDSHLARIRGERTCRIERETNRRVINAAVGGANSLDLARQLKGCRPADTVVVSVGTNERCTLEGGPAATLQEGTHEIPGGPARGQAHLPHLARRGRTAAYRAW